LYSINNNTGDGLLTQKVIFEICCRIHVLLSDDMKTVIIYLFKYLQLFVVAVFFRRCCCWAQLYAKQ